MVGWLVGFYGISTTVGYSKPNHVYIYIYIVYMICNHIIGRKHFYKPRLIFFVQLNCSKYYYIALIVLFGICLYTVK